ncbi:Hypothetical predicted protein [Octopus vulgaris]|uniref:Uncharacterized protein n=1 Tax=Octopus vulgaris TaxID=6645 RepID=A0AA36EY35_OCTVU|nr:Hypothetical predicted protein [Octopus vulgaris]
MSAAPNNRKRKRLSNASNKENSFCDLNVSNSAVNNNLTSYSFECHNTANFCEYFERPYSFNFFPADLVNREPPSYYDESQLQKRRRLSITQLQRPPDIPPLFYQKVEEIVHSIEVIHENVLFNLMQMRNMKMDEMSSKFNTLAEEGPVNPEANNPQPSNDYFAAQYFYQQSLKNDFSAKMNAIANFYSQHKDRLTFQINCIMQQIRDFSMFSNDSMSIQVPVPKGPCSTNDYFLSYDLITLPFYMAADFIKEESIYTSYYLHM